MRSKTWAALVDAKMGVEYLTLYCDHVRQLRDRYKSGIILIAVLGAALFIHRAEAALAACVLILLAECFTKLKKQVIMSDKDFHKLHELKAKYVYLYNKLDKLFTDITDECLSNEEIKKLYSDIQHFKLLIVRLDRELNMPLKADIKKEARSRTSRFLESRYY